MAEVSGPDTSDRLDNLFRLQAGKMVAVLSRILGFSHLESSEEIVQETLLKALQLWSHHGIPPNPGAWLMTVAKNKAFDWIRRERLSRRVLESLGRDPTERSALESVLDEEFTAPRIQDDLLRMIFACCDPRLGPSDQVALTLKFPCGLSSSEIASALLLSENTVRKRLYRARENLRHEGSFAEVLPAEISPARFDSVLNVIYLLFNEGYKTSAGTQVIRVDLCEEAMRLCGELMEYELCRQPKTYALAALMHFHAARLPSRTYDDGSICQLQNQDRSLWNWDLMRRAFVYLGRSAEGRELSRYHLESAVAAQHCAAARFEDTDWTSILRLYEQLVRINDSPVTRLNRAIALGFAEGEGEAIKELRALETIPELAAYYLLPASLGEFYRSSRDFKNAKDYFARALELCPSEIEREYLREKLGSCG